MIENNTYELLKNLGTDYLIAQIDNGHSKKNIMWLHNIPEPTIDKFLQENGTTWAEIYDKAETMRIERYDKENGIQKMLNEGKTNGQIMADIMCSRDKLRAYKEKKRIIKPQSTQTRRPTNTGIRNVSKLKNNNYYQYRKTYANPNNIIRKKLSDLEKVAKERELEWIIEDENKYLEIIKKESN